MLKSYLITTYRNMIKHKAYSLVNIISLAIGITAFVFIWEYVRFEWSYDQFHEKKENIYRVESSFYNGDELTDDWATSSYGYGTAIKETFPGVKDFSRIMLWNSERVVRYKENKFREHNVFYTDPSFLTMFSFPLISGDSETALSEPNTVVLTESTAKKYFGNENPMGKILRLTDNRRTIDCEVTGIIKDIPANSHIQFNILVSWATIRSVFRAIDNFWYQHEAYTYLLLDPGTDLKMIEDGFPELAEKHKTRDVLKQLKWEINLVPLTDIHLNPLKSYEREIKGSRNSVYLLIMISLFILVIAFLNYINLSTARLFERTKEAGLRKVVGATRNQFFAQFLFESALVNIIALIIGVVLLEVLNSTVPTFFGFTHKFSIDLLSILFFIFSFFVGTIVGGIYPAFFFAIPNPLSFLRGKWGRSSNGQLVRKLLIVTQFTASIILIAGTIIVSEQIDFMRNQDLGMTTEKIITLKAAAATSGRRTKIKEFRNTLLEFPGITYVTASTSVPGKEVGMFLANQRANKNIDEGRLYEMLGVDYDFIPAFGLKLLHGRGFCEDKPTDIDGIVVNETAVKLLGFTNTENALHEDVFIGSVGRKPFKIIGIISDYHHESLKSNFKPVMLYMTPDLNWLPTAYYSVKINAADIRNTLTQIENIWSRLFPESSFDYFFLDEFFNAQYKADEQFRTVFMLFTLLAIFVACLGLISLVTYTLGQRTKEIGIRKTMGASILQLWYMLIKDLVLWIVIANLIAWPITYFVMNNWLDNYAFRIEISWWIFTLAGFLMLIIAIAAVSKQVIKTAKTNPVESLRYE